MSTHSIDLSSLPANDEVIEALHHYFSQDEIDLRDVSEIAKQDPIILANILFLVNKVFSKRNSPVVNTLSAAINLVGLEQLKNNLLSIEPLKSKKLSEQKVRAFELIRSRIYVAANLTQFWGEYMGENAPEEMYCASMFTGLNDLSGSFLNEGSTESSLIDTDSVENIKAGYQFLDDDIALLPDSIQQVYEHSTLSNRLKLSVIVYRLVSCFELGFSTQEFQHALQKASDYVGIGLHRAGYDFSRQVVAIDKNSNYQLFRHSQFLLTTNTETVNPLAS